MHSDLIERSRAIRERIDVPQFPLEAIRGSVRAAKPPVRRPWIGTAIVAGVSLVAIAAAAEVARINFVPSGGMVISSDAKGVSRLINSDAEVREAASHLGFPVILPAGLPADAKPMKINMDGTSLLAVMYALPRSHHLWVFLADPKTMNGKNAPTAASYSVRRGYRVQLWRAGAEQVIAVSDGMTASQFDTIQRTMKQEAAR